jgi:hypothetical protein
VFAAATWPRQCVIIRSGYVGIRRAKSSLRAHRGRMYSALDLPKNLSPFGENVFGCAPRRKVADERRPIRLGKPLEKLDLLVLVRRLFARRSTAIIAPYEMLDPSHLEGQCHQNAGIWARDNHSWKVVHGWLVFGVYRRLRLGWYLWGGSARCILNALAGKH